MTHFVDSLPWYQQASLGIFLALICVGIGVAISWAIDHWPRRRKMPTNLYGFPVVTVDDPRWPDDTIAMLSRTDEWVRVVNVGAGDAVPVQGDPRDLSIESLTRGAKILLALDLLGDEVEREVFPATAAEKKAEECHRFWKGDHYAR